MNAIIREMLRIVFSFHRFCDHLSQSRGHDGLGRWIIVIVLFLAQVTLSGICIGAKPFFVERIPGLDFDLTVFVGWVLKGISSLSERLRK